VGLIVYELVTGERAYGGDSVVSVLFKIVHEPPDLKLIPAGPRWGPLRAVVTQALAKRPSDRHPDARSMAIDLQAAIVHLGGTVEIGAPSDLALMPRVSARTTIIREAPTRRTDSPPEPLTLEPLPSEDRASPFASRAALWIAGALLLLALGLTAGGLYWLTRPEPPAASPSPVTQVKPLVAMAPAPASVAPAVHPSPILGSPNAPRASATGSPPPLEAGSSVATSLPTSVAPPAIGLRPEPVSDAAVTHGTAPAETRLARANGFMERGRYAQALEEARAVLRTDPSNAEARDLAADAEAAILIEDSLKKARAALKEGRKDDALEYIRRGLTANPNEGRLLALFREATQ